MSHIKTILVTGGAGFIGSNFILDWIAETGGKVINLDKLTYAGNLQNLASLENKPQYSFINGDINDHKLIEGLLTSHQPGAIVHFAAESHVDRSIHGPEDFIHTNVNGTFHLLEAARLYWTKLPGKQQTEFRFLHVSTDEVFGSLGPDDPPFTEATPYAPNSPYSASKAASDHLVRAYHHTYGLPVITTNCTNNYGPYQFPEKLIPLTILNALEGKSLPIYGDGRNVRDWLYVHDHCEALRIVLEKGRVGETYNIGGKCEKTNIEVVKIVCAILDELKSESNHAPHASLIKFVKDRPGHDHRYAMNIHKIEHELGWTPKESFDTGLHKTVEWYLGNLDWVEGISTGAYKKWVDTNYKDRAAL